MKKLLISFLLPLQLIAAPPITDEIVEQLTPKLNSDRITYFFGSYGVETINIPDSPYRIANLYSDDKIMRTLAIVDFHQPVHEDIKEAHQEICEGGSIGIVLKKHGWKVNKEPVYFGSIELSPALQSWMHVSTKAAAIHVYHLQASKEELLPYCTIIEVHSPEYLDENWLKALYPDQFPYFRENFDKIENLKLLINAFPYP